MDHRGRVDTASRQPTEPQGHRDDTQPQSTAYPHCPPGRDQHFESRGGGLAFIRESLPGRVVFGAGTARSALADEIAALGAKRVLLIATKRGEPLARELAAPLGDRVADVFTGVREHVPAEVADAAIAAAAGADCLVCVGGGSSTGTAKAIAVERTLPIVALPTTYAGSEMTPIWGRTEAGVKRTARSPDALPKVVIYDPDLTVGLPPPVTATSGMNALAHAVEGHKVNSGADPVTALIAREALRALIAGLPRAVAEEDRAEALYGAYLAGTVVAATGAGMHHKLCHLLGGAYDLPHAPTHAVLLPYTARGVAVRASGDREWAGGSPEESEFASRRRHAQVEPRRFARTLDVTAGLRELAERIGAPTSLAEIGMRAADLDDAVRRMPQAKRLLTEAYEGRWSA